MTSVNELPATQLLQSVRPPFSPLLDATVTGVILILNLAISSISIRHADESRHPVGDGGFLDSRSKMPLKQNFRRTDDCGFT